MLEFPFDISQYVSINGQSISYFIFFVMAFFTAIISAILFFHWKKYSMQGPGFFVGEIIYILVAGLLLFWAFVSIN